MREIAIPEPAKITVIVELVEPVEGATNKIKVRRLTQPNMEFKEWLTVSLKNYSPLGRGWDNVFLANKIKKAIEKDNGNVIPLEDDHYENVCGAVNDMQWNTGVAMEFEPFYMAVKDAVDLEEEAKKKEKAERAEKEKAAKKQGPSKEEPVEA